MSLFQRAFVGIYIYMCIIIAVDHRTHLGGSSVRGRVISQGKSVVKAISEGVGFAVVIVRCKWALIPRGRSAVCPLTCTPSPPLRLVVPDPPFEIASARIYTYISIYTCDLNLYIPIPHTHVCVYPTYILRISYVYSDSFYIHCYWPISPKLKCSSFGVFVLSRDRFPPFVSCSSPGGVENN